MGDGNGNMSASETRDEILRHLDKITREMSPSSVNPFTTARIASDCTVSRNLASQYLNDLVRDDLAVKVNARPVLFFHRRGLERYLQTTLDHSEYASMRDLLSTVGAVERQDYDKAIGCDLSLGACVEQLKSAMCYPPNGLPVLVVGEHGTGKSFISRLTHEYGVNSGVLPQDSRFVSVDCSRYGDNGSALERDVFGNATVTGAVREANGGVVYLHRVDHLSPTVSELLLSRVTEEEQVRARDAKAPRPVRFIIATARPAEGREVAALSRVLPITISLPRYSERTEEERSVLVMQYLRTEGRRVASDASISRGALRALVGADFAENLDGLRACITNCCAGAYLNRDDERLTIRSYNLPPHILGTTPPQADDDQLVSGDLRVTSDTSTHTIAFFQQMVDSYLSYRSGEISFDEFFMAASEAIHANQDLINFDGQNVSPRQNAHERVLSPVIEEVNGEYGIELSRKVARSLAQSLSIQLWGGLYISLWRRKNHEVLRQMVATLSKSSQTTTVVVEQIAAKVRAALGVELDELTLLPLYLEVKEAINSTMDGRDVLGVILCHGYSTATSIADAANRILRQRVFEAIDMTYEQEIADIVGPLSRLLERFTYCSTVVVLVDMGSLAQISDAIPGVINGDLYVVNNVSTGLALEVGEALVAHESVDDALHAGIGACSPTYRVVRGTKGHEAIAFCSEAGTLAADKIRQLVQDSLPEQLSVRLITCDYADLEHHGDQATVFGSYRVRALVGTMNPGITTVPFIALGDILYSGTSDALDRALARVLGPEEMAEFHARLLRNLTLRNVAESITILNPEMLYVEADRAMHELSRLSGETIDSRRQIGLYVHLCGLIERLVTKNFVDDYPGVDEFERENEDFIRWFRLSFGDMCRRYKVEIPVSEVAYVHHMLNVDMADRGETIRTGGKTLEDE